VSWVNDVLKSTNELESPERFYKWGALSAIAAVLRKNVYLDRYSYKLWPNIFVVFVARSGLRKGAPVTMSRSLVEEVKCTRIIIGRSSMPQVIKDLSKAYSTEDGKVIKEAHGYLVSGELAAFFVKDPDALTVLTDLYDTHGYEKEWKNSLKGTGVDVLKAPCVTLLGATNEDHFSEAIPPNAVGGGFIARTFLIFEDRRRRINSLIDPPKNLVTVKDLSQYLIEVSKLSGPFGMTLQAKTKYDKWYTSFSTQDHQDPTGTLERIHDGILKVAMLLSLSEDLDLVIHERHLDEAMEDCLKCTGGMRQVTMGQGKSTLAYATKLVLQELIRRPDHSLERQKLLSKYWGQFDAFDLDRIAETLDSAGAITIKRAGKTTMYVLRQHVLDEYTKYKIQIN
jgi:hypothetical protein